MPADQSAPQTLDNAPSKLASRMSPMTTNGLKNDFVRSSFEDQDNIEDGCLDSIEEEGLEDHHYKSLPVRQLHEKFMRSFVNLLLEEAVFEVRR